MIRRLKNWLMPQEGPSKEWIIVASQDHASIFSKTKGPHRRIRIEGKLEHPAGRMLSHELKEGMPGRTFASWRGSRLRHSMESEQSPHEHESEVFAKTIAMVIEKGRWEHRYDELIVVAEPRFLGTLIKHLSRPAKGLIKDTIAKDLVKMSDHDVCEYLQQIMEKREMSRE